MQDTLEYIDSYFTQTLSSEEKRAFELRCEQDEAFAKEVAFYLTARRAARELLMEEKQKAYATNGTAETERTPKVPVRTIPLRKWLSYAAAACVIFIVATFFYLQSQAPAKLAANYIYDNYVHKAIGVTMDASRDSMQLGIEAYNSKNYMRAQALFDGVRRAKPASSYAKKYAGLAYLQTGNYNKALECFKELAAMKDLVTNNGDILAAATLLQRNAHSDKEQAKELLNKVVNEQEEGSEQAAEWLKKLK